MGTGNISGRGETIVVSVVQYEIEGVVKGVPCGLPEELFASHSFRTGAAMMALANGASKEAVKRQGGWLSDAIDVYFIPTLTDLLLAPGKALRL